MSKQKTSFVYFVYPTYTHAVNRGQSASPLIIILAEFVEEIYLVQSPVRYRNEAVKW